MGKQKIVIKVSMNNDKSKSKAMKIVVGVLGVEGASLKGESKDEIEVIGEGVDPVKLACLLRKKFCHAELVSVGVVEKKEEKKDPITTVAWPYITSVPHYPVYDIKNSYEDPICSIM